MEGTLLLIKKTVAGEKALPQLSFDEPLFYLAASHAVATVMAEVAVAISDSNRSAVITGRGVNLKFCKLTLPVVGTGLRVFCHSQPSTLKQGSCCSILPFSFRS